jgi:hypothetical protein
VTVDLTGKAVTEIRDFAAVAAITPRVRGGELADNDAPPAVIVRPLAIDYSPFGQTRRARLQAPLFAALCYGVTRVQAAQLAGAVVDAVNLRGPRKDAQNRLIYLSLVEGDGEVVLDPDTRWPFATVTFTFIGAAGAVA